VLSLLEERVRKEACRKKKMQKLVAFTFYIFYYCIYSVFSFAYGFSKRQNDGEGASQGL